MENRVPLPTDNIYKFYALFGLLMVIFAFGAMIYLVRAKKDGDARTKNGDRGERQKNFLKRL